jgi:hypothetical protein
LRQASKAAAAVTDAEIWKLITPPTPCLHLGLDINTNNSGWTVVDNRGRILGFGVVETSSSDCVIDSAQLIERALLRIQSQFSQPGVQWTVAVEDYLKVFSQRSSAKTLFSLAEINALVRDRCFRIFGSKPLSIHPNQARGFLQLNLKRCKTLSDEMQTQIDGAVQKLSTDQSLLHFRPSKAGGGLDVKFFIFHYVNQILLQQRTQRNSTNASNASDIAWPLDKRGRVSKLSYDIADSSVVAWAAMHRHIADAAAADSVKAAEFARLIALDTSLMTPLTTSRSAKSKTVPPADAESNADIKKRTKKTNKPANAIQPVPLYQTLWQKRLADLSTKPLLEATPISIFGNMEKME